MKKEKCNLNTHVWGDWDEGKRKCVNCGRVQICHHLNKYTEDHECIDSYQIPVQVEIITMDYCPDCGYSKEISAIRFS